ncbi:unnamed protein product [Bacillus thuringiensis DB27]|uniref:Uncharacterized protein n=1 Tax=Bacillus thuringiensis DB27 TaxID=1431339 RepID=W8YDH4_BACTU|nr:unnamed protein product [Bacillus thuringiensis DB27]
MILISPPVYVFSNFATESGIFIWNFEPIPNFLIRQSWNHILSLEESIQQIEEKIDRLLLPYQKQVELLLTISGVKNMLLQV